MTKCAIYRYLDLQFHSELIFSLITSMFCVHKLKESRLHFFFFFFCSRWHMPEDPNPAPPQSGVRFQWKSCTAGEHGRNQDRYSSGGRGSEERRTTDEEGVISQRVRLQEGMFVVVLCVHVHESTYNILSCVFVSMHLTNLTSILWVLPRMIFNSFYFFF